MANIPPSGGNVTAPPHDVTTEAMTTAHLATGVSIALLCAVYDVMNFPRLQISEKHNIWSD